MIKPFDGFGWRGFLKKDLRLILFFTKKKRPWLRSLGWNLGVYP